MKCIYKVHGCGSEGVDLMRGPEPRRELFREYGRTVDPVETLKLWRQLDCFKRSDGLPQPLLGQSAEVNELRIQLLPLCRELPVVRDDFPQQQWHKTKWQLPQQLQVIDRHLPGFWRVTSEVSGLELSGKHGDQRKSSTNGLPCANRAENPNREPSVGAKSVDSAG